MIGYEKQTLKNTQLGCIEIEDLKEEFIKEFKDLAKRKKEYAEYIDNSMVCQQVLTSQIKSSR